MKIRPPRKSEYPQWLDMRAALYPDGTRKELAGELARLSRHRKWRILMAFDGRGEALGLVEVYLRDFADGCVTSPVGYLEGWYVRPEFRKRGIGAALVKAAEAWARSKGCSEMASDAEAGNKVSLAAHQKLGYRPAKTLIAFAKKL